MEIKLNSGDQLTIPEGCKAIINGDSIIIRESTDKFKDGDLLICTHDPSTFAIFKEYTTSSHLIFDAYYVSYDCNATKISEGDFRLATPAEMQELRIQLQDRGLFWDSRSKKLRQYRERVQRGESYLSINRYGVVCKLTENYNDFSLDNISSGNYYYLTEAEQAETDAKLIREIYDKRALW